MFKQGGSKDCYPGDKARPTPRRFLWIVAEMRIRSVNAAQTSSVSQVGRVCLKSECSACGKLIECSRAEGLLALRRRGGTWSMATVADRTKGLCERE